MAKIIDSRMHTAEHILNQTMDRMFNCGRCISAHIEKKKSKCDYQFDRELTPDEITDIQTRVNDIIQQDLPVRETYVARTAAAEKYNTEKLPPDAGDKSASFDPVTSKRLFWKLSISFSDALFSFRRVSIS